MLPGFQLHVATQHPTSPHLTCIAWLLGRLAAEVMPLRQGMSGLLGEDATLLSMPAPSMVAPSAAGGGVSETR